MKSRIIAAIFALALTAGAASDLIARPPEDKSSSEIVDAFGRPPYYYYWLHNNEIGTAFSNYGLFGQGNSFRDIDPSTYVICGEDPCPNFRSPEDSWHEYLYMGGIWIGGVVETDTLVSIPSDLWYGGTFEFYPASKGQDILYLGHTLDRALFTDTVLYTEISPADERPHKPLNIRVANRAHYWYAPSADRAIIYDLVITNIGALPITSGYLGLKFDCDVRHPIAQSGWTDDFSGSLPDAGIGYVIDNDGDPSDSAFDFRSPMRCFAVKFLRTTFAAVKPAFNWWFSDYGRSYDFGPQRDAGDGSPQCLFGSGLGTPGSDRVRYCMLSNGEWDYDQVATGADHPGWIAPPSELAENLADGIDTRFMMSIGPFDLQPDSSVRIIFTIFTGDSVHRDPKNFIENYQFSHPEAFLAGLDFSDVRRNAQLAELLADSILDPAAPMVGAEVQHNSSDSVVIEWDPWVYPDVDGHYVFIEEVPVDSMPYPGVVPPWLKPDFRTPIDTVGFEYRYTLSGLTRSHSYFAGIANRLVDKRMPKTLPFSFQAGGRPEAPVPEKKAIFFQDGHDVTLKWEAPSGVDVDHYNIYRFNNLHDWYRKYYPFYSTSDYIDSLSASPIDSTKVHGKWYYLYAMTQFLMIDSGVTSYTAKGVDSAVFAITAVDKLGFESSFSTPVTTFRVGPRDKDILVLLSSTKVMLGFADGVKIAALYDSILAGRDYGIYSYEDSAGIKYGSRCWPAWWYDIMPYKLVIIDGGYFADALFGSEYCGTSTGLERYIQSGGSVAYFGSFHDLFPHRDSISLRWIWSYSRNWYTYEEIFDYLAIDSISQIGFRYYAQNAPPPPLSDTLIGMTSAEGTYDTIPDLNYDTAAFKYVSGNYWKSWPPGTAPAPSVFVPSEGSEITHTLKSIYPATSLVDGRPIGIKKITDSAIVYCFGFHLWYMDRDDARELINYIAGDLMTATDDPNPGTVPLTFELKQNHPNPFNPTTTIEFTLPRQEHVTLAIYNILGQRIRTLLDESRQAGKHHLIWDGRDASGNSVASGIYLYKLTNVSGVKSRKMLLLR